MDYEVKLEIFEGPLDLLLHLIHKNEVDIFDIPIAIITDQYLAYLDMMKSLNIDVAGDFLIMAATLMHIKSKMLLPEIKGEEDEEDPRLEIAQSLMEYMQFKELAEELSGRELLERDVFSRGVSADELARNADTASQIDVSLFQLMDAFRQVMDQRFPGVQLKYEPEKWSVKDKTEIIIATLKEKGRISFYELLEEATTLNELIVTFLALLELTHTGLLKILQADKNGDIQITASFDEDEDSIDE